MLKILFTNACILLAFIFVGNIFLKNSKLKEKNTPIHIKFLSGLTAGVLGCILIIFSIRTTSGLILDFRHTVELLVVVFMGLTPGIIAGVMIFFFRLIHFGITLGSILGSLTTLITIIIYIIISRFNIDDTKKWTLGTAVSILLTSSVYCSLIENKAELISVLIFSCLGSIIVNTLVFTSINYLAISNKIINDMKEEINKDFLTGLKNVRRFDELFRNAINSAKKRGERLSVLIIDIDFFKKVNDNFGHPNGDEILKQFGEIVTGACRSFDIVSRIGGEEFSVILPDCDMNQAIEVAERIRVSVEKFDYLLLDDRIVNITCSIGCASYPHPVSKIEELINYADKALYKAKETGRNRTCAYNE